MRILSPPNLHTQIHFPTAPLLLFPLSRSSSRPYLKPSLSRPLIQQAGPPSLLKTAILPAPHAGNIRILSLNSPRNRNALGWAMVRELRREVEALKGDKSEGQGENGEEVGTRVLILASEIDECFCAGADLKERRGMSDGETANFLLTLRALLTSLSNLPIPTITAISSLALGGGLELALSTTFRILCPTALLALPETKLGIIPGAGGTYRLPRLIGSARAMELVLTGRRVRGEEARRIGLCERVVEDEGGGAMAVRRRVLDGAIDFAKEICEGAPLATGAAMRAVKGGSEEAERREYGGLMGTEDRVEALRAFEEKRRAVFSGR